eukprot:SAG25_NODE_11347_length_306_cov_1.231884_1_plen_64_part_10
MVLEAANPRGMPVSMDARTLRKFERWLSWACEPFARVSTFRWRGHGSRGGARRQSGTCSTSICP